MKNGQYDDKRDNIANRDKDDGMYCSTPNIRSIVEAAASDNESNITKWDDQGYAKYIIQHI